MSYIDDNLMPLETVQARATLHWVRFLLPVFLLGMAVLLHAAEYPVPALYLASFLALGYRVMETWTTEMAATTKRILGKKGVIARRALDMNISKLESVEVHQSILGRILGYGTLEFRGAGSGKSRMTCISNPTAFKKAVYAQMQD
jgi:uncharacterized membrane protein YdbT with pleckstrin-like domain